MSNNKDFITDIAKFKIKSENTIDDTRKFLAFELFSRVVDRTPVGFLYEPTSGNTKFNWTCTINTLPTSILKGVDKKGNVTKARMEKVLDRVKSDDIIFFSNSVSHIFQIEDGLYPKSPSVGSWNKQTKSYEIRSSGGFSKQAPAGMVKLTLLAFSSVSKNAIRKAQRQNR
jgi:hypothetical protein